MPSLQKSSTLRMSNTTKSRNESERTTSSISFSDSPPPPSAFQHTRTSNNNNGDATDQGISAAPSFTSVASTSSVSTGPTWKIVNLFLIFLLANVVFGLAFMTPLIPGYVLYKLDEYFMKRDMNGISSHDSLLIINCLYLYLH
jgi:hypothetical protein